KLFPRAHIHDAKSGVLLEPIRQFLRSNEHLRILLVTGFNMVEDLANIEARISLAEVLQGFLRLKPAIAASSDMIPAEESPLRSRKRFQYFAHCGLRTNGFGSCHAPKNFWISPRTSTNRSISAV